MTKKKRPRVWRKSWENAHGYRVHTVAAIADYRGENVRIYRTWKRYVFISTLSENAIRGHEWPGSDSPRVEWLRYRIEPEVKAYYTFAQDGRDVYCGLVCFPNADRIVSLLRPPLAIRLFFAGQWEQALTAGLLAI